MFVLTDGYGTEGINLPKALKHAAELGVEVTAISVGREESNVHKVYHNYIKAATPYNVIGALEVLKSGDGVVGGEHLASSPQEADVENLDDLLLE